MFICILTRQIKWMDGWMDSVSLRVSKIATRCCGYPIKCVDRTPHLVRTQPRLREGMQYALCSAVAGLALQHWGCNAWKPLWSSRLPIPISSLHQLMKLSNVKISSHISTPCLKKQSNILFLSERRQISTNFDNFWHKDGQKTIELCKVHSLSTSPNLCQRTTA